MKADPVSITANLDITQAMQDATSLKLMAIEAENAELRARLLRHSAVAGKLIRWSPPKYEFKAIFLNDTSVFSGQLETEQPSGWEVFAIPSERCIVYRRAIDEPEESQERD